MSELRIESYLDDLSPDEFEELISEIWENLGYSTEVTPKSNDKGIDVKAKREHPIPEKVLIQAKAYAERNTVGSRDVRNYATLYRQDEDADQVVIVTTSSFTNPAKELADDLDVHTVDRDRLVDLIQDSGIDISSHSNSVEDDTGHKHNNSDIYEVSHGFDAEVAERAPDAKSHSEPDNQTSHSNFGSKEQSGQPTATTSPTNRSNTRIEMEPESAYKLFKSKSPKIKKHSPDGSGPKIDFCPNCNKEIEYFHRFSPYTFSGEGSSRDRYFELTPTDSDKIVALQRIYGFPCCGAIYHIKDGDFTKLVESDVPESTETVSKGPIKYIFNKLFNQL